MSFILTTADTMMCPHGGTVSISSTNTRALAGAAIVRPSDVFSIAGCPLNVSGAPHPCVLVEWQSPSTKVKAMSDSVLTQSSIGLCKAADQAVQGTVVIVKTQTKASAQ